VRLARAYFALDNIKDAVAYSEKALDIDSSYATALRSLGLCYRYIDKDKGIEYLKRGLEIDNTDYEAWDFLGLFYRDKGLIEDAIQSHMQALASKKRPVTEFYLSILYSQKGDKKRALLMALSAEEDLDKQNQEEALRLVWELLIRAGTAIIQGDEAEALKFVQSLTPYLTTQRTYDEVATHLKILLEATNHKEWILKFIKIMKVTAE